MIARKKVCTSVENFYILKERTPKGLIIMKELFHRTSVRAFTDEAVSRDDILQILRAGMQAPSATDQQPWEFIVVTDKPTLKQLADASPYGGFTASAPAAIVCCYRKDCRVPQYAEIDCSICMENIWLATDSLGLGGTWIGIAPLEERMNAVEKILAIPDTLRAFALFPLGHPAEVKPQRDRFDESRIHWWQA